ncbi:PREDICTED: gap junction delta-3 protein [Dipodomys ordii]|uniref:Gap junction delta-3 protein n=1 Tax=Dipodomys ordii TaxID=10020 RepID=A0A1S3GUZ7_DIPOR|nr:PREDICTED: gap junction delta-3 protein [Dipodomys ordii]
MGEWAFLGSLLDAVQLQSPLVGRLWLVIMLIFRILVLATVGGAVFEDEQEEFVCNTLQPGCRQVCYDRAFPVSHYRFWLFHILLLSAPPVLFVIYSMHQASKEGGGPRVAPPCVQRPVMVFLLKELTSTEVPNPVDLYTHTSPRQAHGRAPDSDGVEPIIDMKKY